MFHWIIFLLLIVSSLSCNFNRCAVCFQSFMNIACRSTQNAARIKRFLRLHIVIKPLNKKISIINSLLCWRVTLLMFTANLALVKCENRLAVLLVILEIFWTFSLKARDWSPWILTEWNLSWQIVKYCILSEVCIINFTVSPQMWCIKNINRLVYTPPDLLVRFCKVNFSKAKNSACFVFQALNLLWSRVIITWLLNVIEDIYLIIYYIYLITRCRMFHSKNT